MSKNLFNGIVVGESGSGSENQVLTAVTGGGLVWAKAIGNTAGRHINIVGNKVSLLISGSLETNGYQIHSSNSLPIISDTELKITANNGNINLSASKNITLSCISNIKINTNEVAINANVNAFGIQAGLNNTGNNCTFIGTNPNTAIVNNISDRLIVYSSSDTPFLYGDTSNMSLGIGTTTLSATLTVSGKISATGILDTLNSSGTANQVLTAGTGGDGLVWATLSAAIGVTAGRNINIPSPDFSVVSVLIDSSLEMNGQQIHTDSSLSIIAQEGISLITENDGINMTASTNIALVCVQNVTVSSANVNIGNTLNAFGYNSALENLGSNVNAFGYSAGIRNTGNNCTFIGTNPNTAIVNNISDRLIVYSSSDTPFLYGDTSNMSLGIGTTTLSATLTVSGKISATGILDTLNSSGTANQVLTAGTGGGLVWTTAIGNTIILDTNNIVSLTSSLNRSMYIVTNNTSPRNFTTSNLVGLPPGYTVYIRNGINSGNITVNINGSGGYRCYCKTSYTNASPILLYWNGVNLIAYE